MCCRRLSGTLAQRSCSIENQPVRERIIVVAEVALALELHGLAMWIRGGCPLDEGATKRAHGMTVEVGDEIRWTRGREEAVVEGPEHRHSSVSSLVEDIADRRVYSTVLLAFDIPTSRMKRALAAHSKCFLFLLLEGDGDRGVRR